MAKVFGKGSRERVIIFGQTTAIFLRKYLTMRAFLLRHPPLPDEPLFVFRNGFPLDSRYVLRAWHRAQKRAGLSPLPFHGLRHGFARMWLLHGGDAFSLQLLLEHKSADMTRRYVTLWGHDLKSIHERISPVDKLLKGQGILRR